MSGCGELARELIQAGLVDELYFWIHPRIQGQAAARTRRRRSRCGSSRLGSSTPAHPAPLRTPAEPMRTTTMKPVRERRSFDVCGAQTQLF